MCSCDTNTLCVATRSAVVVVHSHTVEPLYCGHHWAKKMCPHFIQRLFQRLICTQKYTIGDLRKCPDLERCPHFRGVLPLREVPLYTCSGSVNCRVWYVPVCVFFTVYMYASLCIYCVLALACFACMTTCVHALCLCIPSCADVLHV